MSGNPSTSSGSGGPGGGGGLGYGDSGGGGASCAFSFTTVLASPDPALISGLSVGMVLAVDLQDNPPAVTACLPDGSVVGGITQNAALLRSCMQQGFRYGAEVLAVSGGAVQVQVEPI